MGWFFDVQCRIIIAHQEKFGHHTGFFLTEIPSSAHMGMSMRMRDIVHVHKEETG